MCVCDFPAERVGIVTGAQNWGRQFQILGDAIEKLRAPDAVYANVIVSRSINRILFMLQPYGWIK